jgi:hypothetical protein
MEETNILEAITERDIDLLVLEEIHVSVAFRKWLATAVFGADAQVAEFINAWHSVSDAAFGESDLVLLFRDV